MTKLPQYEYVYAKDLQNGDLLIETLTLNKHPTRIEVVGAILNPTIRLAEEDAAKGFLVETVNVFLKLFDSSDPIETKYHQYERVEIIRMTQEG